MLQGENADKRTWFTEGETLYLTYMIGEETTLFTPQISDTVSLSDQFERDKPFCGEFIFELIHLTSTDGALRKQGGFGYTLGQSTQLELSAEELEYENSEDELNYWGMLSNYPLVNDTNSVVQTANGTLRVTLQVF